MRDALNLLAACHAEPPTSIGQTGRRNDLGLRKSTWQVLMKVGALPIDLYLEMIDSHF